MFISVAVPVPNLDLLTYAVADDVDRPAIGARVLVPLGTRVVTGIVIDHVDDSGAARDVKLVQKVLDAHAFVPAEVVGLARWTAEYYAAGVGDTIPALLPPMARGGRVDAHKTQRIASITPAGLEALQLAAPKQREALELLAAAPDGIPTPTLTARGIAGSAIARLVRHGYISVRSERLARDPFGVRPLPSTTPSEPQDSGVRPPGGGALTRRLTGEQQAACDRLRALADSRAFHVALLHGVTGSGKTEIYLRLATTTRDAGRRVLMLVPEIALTPAIAALFRDTFGDRVAIQHSGLSDGERHDQWHRIRRGDVDVVVGTRSAVFTPLERIGLIVVDEEHDGSYKQEEIPRYNARDVAIVRAQRAQALIVLGSATPSIETYHHAMTGKYERVVLARRVLDRPLADVKIVDMREEYAAEGPDVILSRPLRDAIQMRLERREQSLVLLNRRGFATAVFCRQCAGTVDCPNCSVSLVVHGEGNARRARCHYCNYTCLLYTSPSPRDS